MKKNNDLNELKFHIKAACFLANSTSPKKVLEQAHRLTPSRMHPLLSRCSESEFEKWIKNGQSNRNAYHRLCLTLIMSILSKNRFKIVSADPCLFDESELEKFSDTRRLPKPCGLARGSDFEIKNNRGINLIFCFYNKSREKIFREISERVRKFDDCRFENICFLITPSSSLLNKCRRVGWADKWQRGFFVCFDELIKKISCSGNAGRKNRDSSTDKTISVFNAKVIENRPVGEDKTPKHFKIKFSTKGLQTVVPGQFVMLDTLKISERKQMYASPVLNSLSGLNRCSSRKILKPVSYLKRPFSLYNAFYKYFREAYFKNIRLPYDFAITAHRVFPDEFDIFYKVVEDGVGTNELKGLRKNDTFQMFGPLGQTTDLHVLRSEGIEEVHLIGGGVGMAPLLFFGQVLRYYSFKIKAFIGIFDFKTLLLKNAPDSGKQINSHIYIDDLKNIGLKGGDIYVACETGKAEHNLIPDLPETNFYQGVVTEQYGSYLKALKKKRGILVITCGPADMTGALKKITLKYKLPMKVLLEKRMACGTGVCMSCVCHTKRGNQKQYSRVCADGPLFDAADIDWSKYESAQR